MAAIDSGRLGAAQVLVRLHPRDEVEAYRQFAGVPHLMIEKPFRPTVTAGDGLAVDVMPEHQQHLADTLRHSDVVVNVASTIAIEASIFDTPVVNVSFDGEARVRVRAIGAALLPLHPLREHHASSWRARGRHAEPAGGVGRTVSGRSRRSIARAAGEIVVEQCQFLDGRFGYPRRRTAILEELAGMVGRRAWIADNSAADTEDGVACASRI